MRILADHDRVRELNLGKRRTLKVNPALLVDGGDPAEEMPGDAESSRQTVGDWN